MAKYIKKENPKNNGGRPPKEVNWDLFKSLCEVHCTLEEIAHILDTDMGVLKNKIKEKYNLSFSQAREKLSAGGKLSLRRDQFRLAKRNAAMSIWLGKQYLDQKDTPTEVSVSPETTQKFDGVMAQLRDMQKAVRVSD